MPDEPIAIDALGPDGEYRTRKPEVVTDATGVPVARLSVVPPLYVVRSIAAQRRVAPLGVDARYAALARAGEAFRTGTIAGLDYDAYVEATQRISGIPAAVARAGADAVVEALRTTAEAVTPARPVGAAPDWRVCGPAGGAVWTRRGDVLAVHAPGNAPGVHGLWPQALALGYRVAVRPSRREPLTAHRLILALRQSGFRPEDALYLPTGHDGADDLVRCADLAMVYGGKDVADRYRADPTVLVNGPGQTKILLTAEADWREYLDQIVDSIANLAGMACVNATAVLYEGDPAPLATAIAARLTAVDPDTLPTAPLATAHALAGHLARAAAAATPVLGADRVVEERGDGIAVLRPAVHLLPSADVSALNVELPFPCVWVAPWSRADGVAPLRDSVVVNVVTEDDALIDALLGEPSVGNVFVGRCATHHAAPHIPHEGFLADFLMRNKGFLRC